MRKKLSLAALSIPVTLLAFGACGVEDPEPEGAEEAEEAEDGVESQQQEGFDCSAPDQRLTCDAPAHPNKRFVCQPIGWGHHWQYFKIKVPVSSPWHVPGEEDAWWMPADQAPGASSDDLGFGPGLDCDCHYRECDGVCTGADAGTACDDGDPCTGPGSCNGEACDPGAPLPNGTVCGDGLVCDSTGTCGEVPHVVINEAESSGGVPGDWVELYNAGSNAADVSGWVFKDADDTHVYTLPAGTIIAAGGYLVLEEAVFDFGLGGAESVRLYDAQAILVDSYSWSAHAATTYGRCPDGTGNFETTATSTKGAANDCLLPIDVKINEVESSGGVPGDWLELYNAGSNAADVSGWVFKDADDTHVYTLPAGSTIAAGGYLLLEEAAFGFGLGGGDSARLYDAQASLVDSYSWTEHAATTYGRCPNGTGNFDTTATITKGTANDCAGSSPADAWPGQNMVGTVDDDNAFGDNISGLFYEPGSVNVLWAVRNDPSTLHRLVYNGAVWTPEAGAWSTGKTLRFSDGSGNPDTEDVTKAELSSSAIYVVTERDNDASGVSRMSILRLDTNDAGSELVATHEWNITADLPAVGANAGLEAITWIPDSFLVANALFDAAAGHAYNPAEYANHGTGLFFVGVETTGLIHAYALDHQTGAFTRIATIATGDVTVKALSFDREVGYLWTTCGSACGNEAAVLVPDTDVASPTFGTFQVIQTFARPTTMPNIANEGIAIAPESQCVSGQKTFIWSDDGQTSGHALRQDSIPCGAFIP